MRRTVIAMLVNGAACVVSHVQRHTRLAALIALADKLTSGTENWRTGRPVTPDTGGHADHRLAVPKCGSAVCDAPTGTTPMSVEPTHDPLNRLLSDADALADCIYVLRHWRFAVSEQGFIWVRPEDARPSVASLAGFISLVERCCDSEFPAGMLFDFSRGRIDGEEWTQAFGLLQDLARQLDARWRVIRPTGQGATGVLIYREARRDELRSARHRAKSLGLTCFDESDISD